MFNCQNSEPRYLLKTKSRCASCLILIFVFLVAGANRHAQASDDAANETGKPVLWILPHTHWEGAVFKTREDYLQMGLPHILTALRLLRQFPEYRFTLDQVAYVRPFLERYPEEAADFKRFVAEGRLQIVGGTDVMPDDNMPSGESFVRQMLYGKGYVRQTLGVDVKTSWMLDTFGHHAQMPQLLRLAGFDSFWYFRGVEDDKTAPIQSMWQGLDGTTIRAIKPPFVFYKPPKDFAKFTDFMEKRYTSLAPFSRDATDRVDLDGEDVTDPELYVPELVEQFNGRADKPITLRYGTPSEFEAAVANQSDLPMFKGERNPIYQGIYSTRIELKQKMRESERLLTTAEKLSVLAGLYGEPSIDRELWNTWEPALFNVTHDLASGVMTDYVYDDTLRSYDYSQRLSHELVNAELSAIEPHVDTRGDGFALTVFNTLSWTRSDIAEVQIGFDTPGVVDFDLADASGKIVPAQILDEDKFADGGLRTVKLAFIAKDVPAMGFAVYHVMPRTQLSSAKAALSAPKNDSIDSSLYKAEFDAKTGALTSLQVKQGSWQALRGPANVVAEDEDKGDFWELNHNLNGSQSDMMKVPVNAPKRGVAKFSDEFTGDPGVVSHGPVFSEFKLQHGFGKNAFSTTVRIYNDLPRIDFATQITNHDEHVRYRVAFPTSIQNGRNVQEIPFGAIERPQNVEFPAQNWMDYSDGNHGLTLINRGLPGNNVADGTLLLSVLRSVRIQAYNNVGGFEGQGSDSGLELGKQFVFQYALLPHAGDWTDAKSYRAGLEFNNPLIVEKTESHAGNLSSGWGLIKVSPANVVVSALKQSSDGATVIRVYEASGHPTPDASIELHANISAANDSNLLEEPGPSVEVKDNTIHFDLHPFEIKTFRVRIAIK